MSRKPNNSNSKNDPRYNIRVLDRAFRILTLLSDGKPRTMLELSHGIDLSSSTTFRLLSTMAYYGYLHRNEETNQYSLGLACIELSKAFAEGNDLRRTALPELEALRDDVKETIHLALLDKADVVYLEKIPGLHSIGLMGSRVGGRSPSYCTGVGKVLIAHDKSEYFLEYYKNNGMEKFTSTTITTTEALQEELAEIRHKGFAIDRGEHEEEVWCVAAPIFDVNGEAIAGLSISGPAGRMAPLDDTSELVMKAVNAARVISIKMGFTPDH